MNIVWLTRYISCVLVLLAVLASAITYHPDIQLVGLILPPVFLAAGILGFGLAVLLGRLPVTHWVHQSQPIKFGFVVAAITVTLLLIGVG